jgi:hypothetical protein
MSAAIARRKQLNPGELRYKGRRVNPETFKAEGRDLRRLVGRCRECGCLLRGIAAIPAPDGYNSDLNHDATLVVQCGDCDSRRCEDL